MAKLKKRAEQLSAKVEAELGLQDDLSSEDMERLARNAIGGSNSYDTEKLAAKADELYMNVVQDLGGVEAIQLQQVQVKSTAK